MFSCNSPSLVRRSADRLLTASVVLMVAQVLACGADLRAQVPEGPPKKEYVRLVPDVRLGALPSVRALPLTFDAKMGMGEIPLEIAPQGFWKSKLALDKDAYDLFEFNPATGAHLTVVGEPDVPVQVVEVDIPPNAEFAGVVFRQKLLKTVENVTLAPNQEPLPVQPQGPVLTKRTVTVNKAVYTREAAFPGKFFDVTGTVLFGGRKIVILKTFPVQFYPASKKVEFFELQGSLRFKAKEVPKQKAKRDVLGPEGHALELPPPTMADAEQWPEYQREIPEELRKQVESIDLLPKPPFGRGIPCVIITAELFFRPAMELASHRSAKGLPTVVVQVPQIEKAVAGKDPPDKIRNFIRVAHASPFRTQWIILFGDVVPRGSKKSVEVPTRMVVDPAPYLPIDDGWIPCDFYYACLDGTWDGNNNGKYGELQDQPDLAPEVCVGRIPTNDLDDAYRFVRAIIKYENGPPKPRGALLAASDLGWGCHELVFKQGTVLPLVQSLGVPTVQQLYQKTGNLSPATFAKAVNGGVDFIQYYGHGSPDSWWEVVPPPNKRFMDIGQVNSLLHPTPSFPLVFALSCSTSRYDRIECLAEAWVEGIKASGYVGSTRVAYGSGDSGEGLDTRFIGNYLKLQRAGCSLDYAKYQLFKDFGWQPLTLKTVLEFTLLGDPVMKHVK